MRGSKVKRLKKADPWRPNPGRKHGGTPKMEKRLKAVKDRLEQ